MKIHELKILFLFACVSCGQSAHQSAANLPVTDSIQNNRPQKDTVAKYVEAFKGTLLCADCPGIVTEITFINDNLSYRETNTYLERNVKTESTGSYTTDRGYKTDEDATVYVLDDNKPGHERRFLKLDDKTLLMLDANGEKIDTTSFFKLFRVK